VTDVALAASGLRKSFGADGVVDGVDLTVRENEILVLMGPNGVGKTVLLSCLAGSQQPTDGERTVFGRPVTEDRGESYAFLLQDSMAVDTLTGRENAAFYGRLHPAFTDRWESTVAALGLEDALDKRVETYSEGMRRKLELALTTSVDVPLYLLDEPTAGVDLSMIQRFHDRILDRRADGATFVITSHRPMDAELADRVAFMPDGSIATVGEPTALLADLPPVVRVTGAGAIQAAESHVVDGELFRLGSEARGFLAPDRSLKALREAVTAAGGSLDVIDPTYTDLFNYYVHMNP
jgi:ABC-2 type transport system ATP-binding protein